jgi:hypothetical protein
VTFAGRLTADHFQLINRTCNRWLAAWLSTEAADQAAAETAVRRLYDANGLSQPRITIWMDSPLGCVYAGAACQFGDQGGQNRADTFQLVQEFHQLVRQLQRQLTDQIESQLPDKLGSQLLKRLWEEFYGKLDGSRLHGALIRQISWLPGRLWSEHQDHHYPGQLLYQTELLTEPQDERADQRADRLPGAFLSQLRDQLPDQLSGQPADLVPDRGTRVLLGSYGLNPWKDAYWIAVYSCALQIAGLPPDPCLDAIAEAVTSCWWIIAMPSAVILGQRPAIIRSEHTGAGSAARLHSATGPALAWADGFTLYAWQGRVVPEWVVVRPTADMILAASNVEIRRCAIESMGWHRFAAEAGLVPVDPAGRSTDPAACRRPDPGNPGQHLVLYDIPEQLWGSRVRLLVCTNGSPERDGTRRHYGLTVPAGISDPVQAAAWTYGLTRDEYAECQRRT